MHKVNEVLFVIHSSRTGKKFCVLVEFLADEDAEVYKIRNKLAFLILTISFTVSAGRTTLAFIHFNTNERGIILIRAGKGSLIFKRAAEAKLMFGEYHLHGRNRVYYW